MSIQDVGRNMGHWKIKVLRGLDVANDRTDV